MTDSKKTTKTSRRATKKTSATKTTTRKTTAKKATARSASAGKTNTRKTNTRKKPAGARQTGNPSGQPVGDDQVALRAYEIWQQQGQPMGLDTQHWYQAERELRG